MKHVITDFGAVGDGATLSTFAIQNAIDEAARRGGGTVLIPPGTFRSGSIFLKQDVELQLDEGAVLLGSTHIEDYPKRQTRIEGHFEPWRMALVNAQGLSGVRIGGAGILDGSGVPFWEAFWARRRENPNCTNLEVERPRLMFLDRCSDVQIEGISFHDAAFWNLHLYRCREVLIQNLRIELPSAGQIRGPSTDGIDLDSCQNATIRGCYISVNDDNIALKGSKGPLADRDLDSPPVENIVVENVECGDGNGLITCGSEATIVRNVAVRNCKISGRATLLTLKLRPDTPQRYENISFEGIQLSGEGRVLNVAPWKQFFDLQGHAPPLRTVKDISIRHLSGQFRAFGTLRGNRGDTLQDITLANIDLKLSDERLMVGQIENFVTRNVKINGKTYQAPEKPAS
ncbi:MAG TPA: glycosyl hydrolase family 28 protein [Abditibacterium sp.]